MSEYWKSTPKYWCKYCSIYVKDTKFEKQQHEATGRHQGNIQRSLKGLHREQANQERQKQRAKDEVARLNGLVPSASSSANPVASAPPTFAKTEERKATLADRKKQWEQLAAMGIAVPDEARGDLAQTGGWQVVREEVVGEVGEDGQFKKIANKGVHKRKLDEDEEERVVAEEMITKHRGWGRTYKSLPGNGAADDEDVEALFAKAKKPDVKKEEGVEVKEKEKLKGEEVEGSLQDIPTAEEAAAGRASSSAVADALIKKEEDIPTPAVVFKKRKKIPK
ncbi:hypothetical protein K458DRAFT_334230 [Lentithecium fluviatile CBS 122367]|uniref:U1-type domain-containing protein n=1 Tax=Lentithecium fluviatile CBS 122367 TaxID=1168545 RepID=A0A6G1J7I3_9PLEO|nr:hypothetical protein K458DRAFT_334230 [Lentithecium fluviatile CBS 122367]